MSAPTEVDRTTGTTGIIEVLVVDDHEVVRAGVAAALSRDGRMTVVASASDGREAIARCRERRPHVAVIDMRLPDLAGHELCRHLREQSPDTAVVVLSTHVGEESVRDCLRAGAAAYVTKAAGLTELRSAIVDAHRGAGAGHRPPVPQIVRRLEQLVAARDRPRGPADHGEPEAGRGLRPEGEPEAPTPAQSRVLALAAQGLTYGRIARELRISESTVRFHIQKLKAKLGVHSRSELAVAAVRAGLVEEGAGAAG